MNTPTAVDRLTLSPPGALLAFSREAPDVAQAMLQSVLAERALPDPAEWAARSPAHAELLEQGQARGWLQVVHRDIRAPDMRLVDFLAHVVGGLSADRRAALASGGGFCVGHSGYEPEEAEALCVAAADFTEFARRQRARGWNGASDLVSFHQDAAMMMPTVSFVPFWVDGVDYCLVIGGEPLLNNPVFVELLWGIKAAGSRFGDRMVQRAAARGQAR